MSRHARFLALLLATASAIPAFAQPVSDNAAAAQPAGDGADDMMDDADGEEIVVVGQKPRGSVVGDIPPENTLTGRDIRATGATSISELLDAVASQTGSARGRSGGRPILLLNGQRISGFRELRDLPPEAIQRMEILPEEVALKYGYAADQRVVNIVLRRRFNSTTAEARGKVATEGGYASGQADATRLIIRDGQRTSLNFHVEGNNPLYENERDLVLQPIAPDTDAVDPRPFRTLVGARQDVRLSGTVNRTILGDVSATLNGEVERETSRSRFGVPTGTLDRRRDGDPPRFPRRSADAREQDRIGPAWRGAECPARQMAAVLDRQRRIFAEHRAHRSWLRPDRRAGAARRRRSDLRSVRRPWAALDELDRDRSRSVRTSFALDGTATGPLVALPAGDANATFKVAAGRFDLDSEATRRGIASAV